jgi:hypothetical protein
VLVIYALNEISSQFELKQHFFENKQFFKLKMNPGIKIIVIIYTGITARLEVTGFTNKPSQSHAALKNSQQII